MPCPLIENVRYPNYIESLAKSVDATKNLKVKELFCRLRTPRTEGGCIILDQDDHAGLLPSCIIPTQNNLSDVGENTYWPIAFDLKDLMYLYWCTDAKLEVDFSYPSDQMEGKLDYYQLIYNPKPAPYSNLNKDARIYAQINLISGGGNLNDGESTMRYIQQCVYHDPDLPHYDHYSRCVPPIIKKTRAAFFETDYGNHPEGHVDVNFSVDFTTVKYSEQTNRFYPPISASLYRRNQSTEFYDAFHPCEVPRENPFGTKDWAALDSYAIAGTKLFTQQTFLKNGSININNKASTQLLCTAYANGFCSPTRIREQYCEYECDRHSVTGIYKKIPGIRGNMKLTTTHPLSYFEG